MSQAKQLVHFLRPIVLVSVLLHGSPAWPEQPDYEELEVTDRDRQHWAFQPLTRPALPEVANADWVRQPVDRFILQRLERLELQPMPEAPRFTLIRRLSYDLLGLPPTPGEIREFLEDESPDAYQRLVERMLASPRYGERWAQHWLDLARFAETDGFEHDHVREEAWRYRDWVIGALNADMPYDEFIRWQLAGDELSDDPDAAIATMFCLAGPDMPDVNSQEERRHNLLNEMTSTVGSVFMGLQMECAQCHDHKYDAISTSDFYRLRAIFQPAVHVQRNQSVSVLAEKDLPEPTYVMLRGDYRAAGPEVQPDWPRIANLPGTRFEAVDAGNTSGRRLALAQWLTQPEHPLTARVMVNRVWQYHFGRGLSSTPSDFGVMGNPPSHPELLDWLAVEFIEQGWSLKQLHRTIVNSATYRQASYAESPNWSASQREEARRRMREALERDGENVRYSRFPRRRLEGETLRDAMLAAAGKLNLETGGAGVRPPLPDELRATLLRNQWNASEREADHMRRSVYVFARRNLRYPIFDVFDRPDANVSCPERSQSTTAPQSLLMLNSEFTLVAARHLAGRVLQESGSKPSGQVQEVFWRTLNRPPTAQQREEALQFLVAQQARLADEGRPRDELALPVGVPVDEREVYAAAALTDLCLALLNSNAFLYVD